MPFNHVWKAFMLASLILTQVAFNSYRNAFYSVDWNKIYLAYTTSLYLTKLVQLQGKCDMTKTSAFSTKKYFLLKICALKKDLFSSPQWSCSSLNSH